MPNIQEIKTRSCLEVPDLPDPTGINVVSIERFDSVEYAVKEGNRMVTKTRWVVYFHGYLLPLRLHNRRLDAIASALGSDQTEDWYNRKIGLITGMVDNFGKTELGVLVHPHPVDPNALVSRQRVVTIGSVARHNQLQSTNSEARSAGALPPGVAVVPPATGPIGKETAAKIMFALKVRGKSWTDLMKHLRLIEADSGCVGVVPYEVPQHVPAVAKAYLSVFPVTREIDLDLYVKTQIANWTPPEPSAATEATTAPALSQNSSVSGEVINRRTGEVKHANQLVGGPAHELIDESDIPF